MNFVLRHKQATAILIALILTALIAIGFSAHSQKVSASAPPGIITTIATTSVAAVTATQILVFATSSCSTRIISTTNIDGIRISFTDGVPGTLQGFQPTATQGFWQGASTTVAYDATQYGCGALRVFSGTPQTITVSESR